MIHFLKIMAAHITPTFLLKGLDFKRLVADYHAGFFSRIPPKKEKIIMSKTNLILAQEYGTTNYDSIFSVKDKYNSNVVIATIGHTDFEIFTKTGGKLASGGRCDYCKEDIVGVAVGYPIAYQENVVLVEYEGSYRNRIVYTFWVEGRHCNFECALAFLKRILCVSSDCRDTSLRDSERMLKMLYKLNHPKEGPLMPAQDPRLMIVNGGPLTKEQWKDKKHEYVRTDRVLCIPSKTEYVRLDYVN
jgi:hypothetical protein